MLLQNEGVLSAEYDCKLLNIYNNFCYNEYCELIYFVCIVQISQASHMCLITSYDIYVFDINLS